MVVLGIESTAHTASVGIVGADAQVLGLASDFYRPPTGGIHPREAANHHVEVLPSLRRAGLGGRGRTGRTRSTPWPSPRDPASDHASGPARPSPACCRSHGTALSYR